jgi:hypothetical protein
MLNVGLTIIHRFLINTIPRTLADRRARGDLLLRHIIADRLDRRKKPI